MDKGQVQRMIVEHFKTQCEATTVAVTGEGGKFEARVVSDCFKGIDTLGRHQSVYAAVQPALADGRIHALSIRAYTPEEAAATSA